MNQILINNQNVLIKEYEGKRVITFKDIDMVHNRPEGTARKRFNDNKKHFIEGEDFYILDHVRNSDAWYYKTTRWYTTVSYPYR